MTDNDISPATTRWRHIVRLVAVRDASARAFLSGRGDPRRRCRRCPAHRCRHGSGRAADLHRGVCRPRRGVCAGTDSGRRQWRAVRSRARAVRDAWRDGRNRDHHLPRRPARRPRQRTSAARRRARRSPRPADRTARVMGRRRPAVHPWEFRMRWPATRSARLEFRCGRSPSERSSGRRHARSSTRHWARRSGTCRRRWRTRRSRCGA